MLRRAFPEMSRQQIDKDLSKELGELAFVALEQGCGQEVAVHFFQPLPLLFLGICGSLFSRFPWFLHWFFEPLARRNASFWSSRFRGRRPRPFSPR